MHRHASVFGVSLLAMLFAATAPAAPKGLGQAEAEQLIKGNTAEGTNRWKKNMTWFFAPSGVLRKRDDLGNKGRAQWHVNPKGELCFQDKHMKSAECGAIVPRADGGYDVYLEGMWTWTRVSPGNPHKL